MTGVATVRIRLSYYTLWR